ncbi:MAG TPA: hypothetical protein VN706_05330 [Gemmatimonadaceae bacterium]|nr:hypothetical protein [Gemmatimonadaceae bacterium]
MTLPLFPPRIDPEQPLSDEAKRFIAQHGSTLMRAVINELDHKQRRINQLERERDELRRRVGDNRGLIDG